MKVRNIQFKANCNGGFTLIELLIVAAVLAILTTASVAGYRNYVQRANRVDASSALLRISAAQERFYLQNSRYATTASELTDPPPDGLGMSGTMNGWYDLSVAPDPVGGAAVGYIATATASASGSQRDDECQSFRIDQSGQRGAVNAGGNESAEITARCWR
ncbi:MAG: type IV pilin protein [Gammaproteobacteria bacterium]